MRAVTDAGTTVAYRPDQAPGVANLLDILAACTGGPPGAGGGAPLRHLRAAGPGGRRGGGPCRFSGYGELKEAVADAVVDALAPVRERYLRLADDPERVRSVLRAGACKARRLASEKV